MLAVLSQIRGGYSLHPGSVHRIITVVVVILFYYNIQHSESGNGYVQSHSEWNRLYKCYRMHNYIKKLSFTCLKVIMTWLLLIWLSEMIWTYHKVIRKLCLRQLHKTHVWMNITFTQKLMKHVLRTKMSKPLSLKDIFFNSSLHVKFSEAIIIVKWHDTKICLNILQCTILS